MSTNKTAAQNTSIAQFDYDLPEERIAKYPLELRDCSNLLVYKNGEILSDIYSKLHEHLPENTLLVMNNTKVVEARLLFKKNTGSTIEIFCLEPHESYPDITSAMLQTNTVLWKCLVGGAKKWRDEDLEMNFEVDGTTFVLTAKKVERLSDSFLIEFSWNKSESSFAEILHHAGIIPLPPYLKRDTEEKDKTTYQTVYAEFDGSVAAPTAGLHFTENVFENLATKNISHDFVTLHVGAGTFKPVKTETLGEHEMHAEFIDVKRELISKIAEVDSTIVVVGTTSLRTLESLYWMGVKTIINPQLSMESIALQQWDAYELPQSYSKKEAFLALESWMQNNNLERLITKTQLLIAPGYDIRTVNGILTNFHQPQSTLLLLIHAFVGDEWKTIYDFALANNYRFLSYGDGSLLWKV
jgi:S-adenosylmethionine:tRNA ribosyltransferase-isomerase